VLLPADKLAAAIEQNSNSSLPLNWRKSQVRGPPVDMSEHGSVGEGNRVPEMGMIER
jgi:hypothetical protein